MTCNTETIRSLKANRELPDQSSHSHQSAALAVEQPSGAFKRIPFNRDPLDKGTHAANETFTKNDYAGHSTCRAKGWPVM